MDFLSLLPFSITNNLMTDVIIILFLVFLGIFIALKIFQYFLKAFVVGMFFSTLPFIASMMGLEVTVNYHTIVWFLFAGMLAFFAYSSINFAFRVTGAAMSPFRRLFALKGEKEEKEKDEQES